MARAPGKGCTPRQVTRLSCFMGRGLVHLRDHHRHRRRVEEGHLGQVDDDSERVRSIAAHKESPSEWAFAKSMSPPSSISIGGFEVRTSRSSRGLPSQALEGSRERRWRQARSAQARPVPGVAPVTSSTVLRARPTKQRGKLPIACVIAVQRCRRDRRNVGAGGCGIGRRGAAAHRLWVVGDELVERPDRSPCDVHVRPDLGDGWRDDHDASHDDEPVRKDFAPDTFDAPTRCSRSGSFRRALGGMIRIVAVDGDGDPRARRRRRVGRDADRRWRRRRSGSPPRRS